MTSGVPSFVLPKDIDWVEFRTRLRDSKLAVDQANLASTNGISISERTVTARDGYEIPIRLYQPSTPAEGGAPLIIFFHGGGFCFGDLDGQQFECVSASQNFGAVVVNVDYRLSPEHPFPAAIFDSEDVLKWSATNSKELGANPSSGLIVAGTSAGGSIAAVLQVKSKKDGMTPPVTGALLVVPAVTSHAEPPSKYAAELLSLDQNKNAPLLDLHNMNVLMDAYKPDLQSPLFNILALEDEQLTGLCPTFFQVCGADPLRDEALVYARELKRLGNITNVRIYPGLPHGFWTMLPDWQKSKDFITEGLAGLAWLIQQKKYNELLATSSAENGIDATI